MTEKHIFESPDGLVLSSLRGVVAQNPALRLHIPTKTVYIASPSAHSGIAVISGGGAGHEPAHAGYTGHGMLTSSVSGDIFASPSARQILVAIEFATFAGSPQESSDTPASSKLRARDVLISINNYTGDRLNFGLAIEQARARHPQLNIALLTLGKHTPARPGDRTVVDALAPLCASLVAFASQPGSIDPSSSPTSILIEDEQNALHQEQMFDAAVKASEQSAESTHGMSARLGRASYVVGGSMCGGVQGELPPDPGAWGVAAIVEGGVCQGVEAGCL
ncbi:hypothetical protein F5I97DRAFT_1924804 [Phlebopus sp. FC_14]|nr:hypothetical protein F5I97DRAFT_1924804 [Phlebopus sp. FC_14]